MTLHLIDVGSTSIKYARCDRSSGRREAEGAMPFPGPLDRPQPFYEVDSRAIVEAVRELLKPVQAGDRVRIAVQMHGYLLCDADGQTLTPYISWRDQRSLLIPEEERYPFDLPRSHGVGKKPNLPLAGLEAMRRLMPEVMERANMFCTLGSYLALKLTGKNRSHITDLAPTGMYDARSGEACVKPMGLSLPEAKDEQTPVGLYRGAEVYAPVGDQQASTAGSVLKENQYLLNIGTAAQLCALSVGTAYGEYESRPYFGGKTLCTVTGLIGGRDFAALEREKNADALARSYGGAIELLPRRESIRAVGGACRHYRALVEAALERIGLPWEICDEVDALDGLIRIEKGRDG